MNTPRQLEVLVKNDYSILQTKFEYNLPQPSPKPCKCNCFKNGLNCADDSCIERRLQKECKRNCLKGDKCQNQRFRKRIYAKTQVRPAGKKGFGLFALEDIKSKQFVIEYTGEVLTMPDLQARYSHITEENKNLDTYSVLINKEFAAAARFPKAQSMRYVLDGATKGNNASFINSSCNPNCIAETWQSDKLPVIGIFAIRDIQRGEEITFKYDFEDIYLGKKLDCHCGYDLCKKAL